MGFVNGKLLALILCAGLLLSLCACGGSTRDYEGEIRLLKEENVALQEQVRQLEEQLDQLKNTLDARGTGAGEPASIQFAARPLSHEEGQTARLLVMRDGMEETILDCGWDGERFTANLTLQPEDGYGYYCVLTSPDGATERITLSTQDTPAVPKLVYLKSSLESFAGVTLTDARVDQNVVTVNVAAAVQTPLITRDGQAVGISQAELLWMRDDEVMDSCPIELVDGETEGGFAGSASNVSFRIPEMGEESQLSLMLSVQLSDGQTLTAEAGSWTMAEGTLVEAVG